MANISLHGLGRMGVLALLLTPMSLQAHFYPQSADCRAPAKPLEFVTELDQQAFDAKVAQYRECLESFVDSQNQAMSKHQTAAEQAAQAWKSYVETVLESSVTATPQ